MSPTLVIRAVKLHVTHSSGSAGRTLRFARGLNLIRADNTSGKSTALQAIVYALGLEGMLSASRQVPLPHAMTDRLSIEGTESTVLASEVMLEIENGAGEVITVTRSVVSATRDRRLISVARGAAITSPGKYDATDYFVRASGAAQNEAGFHRYLSDFLGLALPRVSRVDGSETPLYLETLFPYFYVEQKHGWSGLQARIPNYFGIRDVGKRSAEFVLGLEAFDRVLLRQRISSNMAELDARWQAISKELADAAKSAKVILQNPHGRIASGIDAQHSVPVIAINDNWVELGPAIENMEAALSTMTQREVPEVGQVSSRVESDLRELEAGLQSTIAITTSLWEEQSDLEARLVQLDLRIEALTEDLQRHKDSRTLQGFGSEHVHAMISEHICPTCHQDLQDGIDISAHAMTIAESIDFIQRQLATFSGSRADTKRVLRAMEARLSSLTDQAQEYRREIRAAKDTLSSATSMPSTSDIRRRLQIEERLELLVERKDSLFTLRKDLSILASTWALQKEQLSLLSATGLSTSDESKISKVEASVRDQLGQYQFDSMKLDEVEIDRDTYRPTNDGFDLGFDLSASDMIRVIWAYLFALLKVGVQSGAHLGLLIFDEPQQQQTARDSYRALLHHAAREASSGSQIIFATSETSDSLHAMVSSTDQNIIDLRPGEKLLQPL